ncbi:MAG: glutamate--tRNA ligase, partial [Bosea sp.]|nr:glutamate--tRNA ligase [Bosea sp. (in: a-proteobacteria)]
MTVPFVRTAPSPTGYLHIGNARSIMFNWLFAMRHGGRFLLRYDDTDRVRSKPEFAAAIPEDLAWLGVIPDASIKQSERLALYDEAAERLRAASRLYPCYESADELDRKRKRQLARGLPPVYDRAALKLTAAERAALEAEGRKPHWRFLLDWEEVGWNDLVRGPSHVDCASLSDPVLVREDGTYPYTLPSVVDDVDMGITHVIRGEDHVTNTAVQIQIIQALGGALPIFGHHNLLTTASGEGLSKRLGHLSLRGLREAGVEPLAVAALAVLTGTSDAVRPVASLDELAGLVEFAHVSRAPAKFDEHEL